VTTKSALEYPFTKLPGPGECLEIAPGVHWVRMTLPFALDHINLLLLEDDDGWTIVDTGLATDETVAAWQQIFKRYTHDRPLKRVIVTHMHPDHIGLAGWLVRNQSADLCISRTEYFHCRYLLDYNHHEAPKEAISFYRSAGFSDEQMDFYRAQFGGYGKMVRSLPHSFRRLMEGQELTIGGRQWQVMIGEGHSSEHVCLYCPDLNLLISGDQILPAITSNVSVWPTEPEANPLEDWLASCARLKQALPADVLVIPAHGRPFIGARERLQQLIDGHDHSLTKLEQACIDPLRVIDTFELLFRNTVNRETLIFATGEGFAHLNCLLARGLLEVRVDKQGVNHYRSRSGAVGKTGR
jgi:glyoxylase-like metal-dependent hydrolase (beta-lactamase superfamily II)